MAFLLILNDVSANLIFGVHLSDIDRLATFFLDSSINDEIFSNRVSVCVLVMSFVSMSFSLGSQIDKF